MTRPIGYFVHHQGRGHAERCAAIASALPADRPLRIFSARDDIFPALPVSATIELVPSLFEPRGDEPAGLAGLRTPRTLHCAPVGWSGIRQSMGRIAAWFAAENPVLMICDVSAEVGQLARLCSVPHVAVVQHGDRDDPGHLACYDGAIGLLAPFSEMLAQPEWSRQRNSETCFAGGLGLPALRADRQEARRRLGFSPQEEIVLVMSGAGGSGFSSAALGVGARSRPQARWITIGKVQVDWHATEPANLEYRNWVDTPLDYLAAADLVISSTGNTTCDQVLGTGRPWIAIPEWRYFDEQHRKADMLREAGLAVSAAHLPSSEQSWSALIERAHATHRADLQAAAIRTDAAAHVAAWIENLIDKSWGESVVTRGCEHNV